jgi:hypothetical protein
MSDFPRDEDDQRAEYIRKVSRVYARAEAVVTRASRLRRILTIVATVLSLVTSGGLWLLVSERLPESALWFGAVASTITTGITIFISLLSLDRVRADAVVLYKDVGSFLARLRGGLPVSDDLFWQHYKDFELRLLNLEHPHTA